MSEKMRENSASIKDSVKKGLIAAGIFLTLGGAAETANAEPVKKQDAINLELVDNFSKGKFDENVVALGDSIDNPRSIEKIATDYLNENVYINGKKIKEFGAKVTKKGTKYAVEFDYELNNGEKSDGNVTVQLEFSVEFKDHNISLECNNYGFIKNQKMKFKDNILADNGNIYDVVENSNGKTSNFVVAYNKYRTDEAISKRVKQPTLRSKKAFPESVSELRNLNNNIILGKEINNADTTYQRDLFFAIGGDYIKILSVPFDKDGIPSQVEGSIKILGIDTPISVDDKLNVTIPQEFQTKLVEKVTQDKNALTNLLNNGDVSHPEFFEGLNYVSKNGMWGFDSDKISLADPIKGIYSVEINEKYINNNKLYFKIDGEGKISITDKIGSSVSAVHFNFGKDNYYKVSCTGQKVDILKMKKPGENPEAYLPSYSGDPAAIRLMNQGGLLTDYSSNGLRYFDIEGNLVANIPCEKLTDGTYKLKEGYSTHLNTLKLYRYNGNNALTSKISQLSRELGITDIFILDIFEQCLKDKGVNFNMECVEIKDTQNGGSIYYELGQRSGNELKITKCDDLYSECKDVLSTIVERLNYLKKIESSRILWRNGKKNGKPYYEEFTSFGGGQNGIGLENISPETKKQFISKGDDIIRKLMWGDGKSVSIQYSCKSTPTISGDNSKITIGSQVYKASINKDRNVVVDPIEEKE